MFSIVNSSCRCGTLDTLLPASGILKGRGIKAWNGATFSNSKWSFVSARICSWRLLTSATMRQTGSFSGSTRLFSQGARHSEPAVDSLKNGTKRVSTTIKSPGIFFKHGKVRQGSKTTDVTCFKGNLGTLARMLHCKFITPQIDCLLPFKAAGGWSQIMISCIIKCRDSIAYKFTVVKLWMNFCNSYQIFKHFRFLIVLLSPLSWTPPHP